MAVGDDAFASGYPLVPNTGEEGKAKYGAREINRTRDFLAQAVLNLTRRRFATVDKLAAAQGLFRGQQALVTESNWVYDWDNTAGWRLYEASAEWSPEIIGAAPFNRGSDSFTQGKWQVHRDTFILSCRVVFGGATNFDTSGQHVAITQLPGEISMDYVNTSVGWGLYRPKNNGPQMVPVLIIPNGNGQLDLRLINTRGSMGYGDESYSAIAGEQQSDEFRFTLTGFRVR